MAIVLDEPAKAALQRRRARGKDDRILLRRDQGSLRAGAPSVSTWAGPHRVR